MNPADSGARPLPPVPVVAAVIHRGHQVLVCRRPEGKRHAELWEFPGGKLADAESIADAVRRELREELAVDLVSVGPELHRARDPGSRFEIHFVAARIAGTPRAIEHSEIRWCMPNQLRALSLAPADESFVVEYFGRASRP